MQQTEKNDVIEIDVLELLNLMLHRLWLILLCGILVGGAAFVLSAFVLTPQYESTTKIYILNKTENTNLTYSDTQLATQLTKDYGELITCRYVLETVIGQCGLEDDYEDLEKRVSVENAADTRIIGITVKDPNPVMARDLADCIRDVASEHIKSVTAVEAVNVVDAANLPDEPSEPSVLKWSAIGALIGIFLCVLILAIRYIADDTIKSEDDVEKYLALSTLALIPMMDGNQGAVKGKEKRGRKENSAGMRRDSNCPQVTGQTAGSKDRNVQMLDLDRE